MPGTTKRVATVVWSISIAVVLLVLTTSVMLPSTKRARISFDDEERTAATQHAETNPSHVPASNSNNSDFDQQKHDELAKEFEQFSSSKSGVFRIEPSPSTTEPTHIFGSKAAVFDLDKSNAAIVLPTPGEVSITLDKQPVTKPGEDDSATRMHIGSSKSMVFPLKPPTTAPATNPDR